MRSRIPAPIQAAAAVADLLVLLLIGCQSTPCPADQPCPCNLTW